jgi:hypothetical protein
MKHAPAAALLLFLAAAAAPAAGVFSPPPDGRANWTVGVAVLSAEGLSGENSYLAGAIALLVRDRLSSLPWHVLPEEERALVARATVARELAALAASIAKLRAERDEALFTARQSAGVSPARAAAAARAAAEKSIAEMEARADYLRSLDPAAVEVAPRKPLVVIDGPGPARLFEPPAVSAQEFCQANGLDMLVSGSVSEVQGFLRLDIRAWHAEKAGPVFSWREAGSREELYLSLQAGLDGLVEPVLGMPWAVIALRTDPVVADVAVDGETVSRGGPRELYLSPGPHEVRVTARGHGEEVRQVDLAAGSVQELAVALVPLGRDTVTIASDPPGADLYLDALWLGKTPVTFGLPPARSRAMLSMQGYLDLPFSLGPGAKPPAVFTLEPADSSRGDLQKAARDRFYRAFGWFLVSLPAPLFCYRYSYDYAAKAADLVSAGDLAGAQAAVNAGTALYWTSVGGAALSASLFGWVVSAIVRYIAVSDRAAG